MSRISLSQVINDSFINRFAGLASSASSSNPLQSNNSSESQISSGLRYGARVYATAVQAMNSGITVVNLASTALENVQKITDKLYKLTEQATRSDIGQQKREELNLEFHKLGREFKEILENTEVGDKNVLTKEGLSEYLVQIGLDQENSDSIAALFKEFRVLADDSFASEEIEGARPVTIPAGAYANGGRRSRTFDSLFDADIADRPTAYIALNDLKALRSQIKDNLAALKDTYDVIGKNLDLVRATGFAFLDLSSQITTAVDAEVVAEQVRQRIRQDAPAALSQAENLEPITVAALALDPSKLT